MELSKAFNIKINGRRAEIIVTADVTEEDGYIECVNDWWISEFEDEDEFDPGDVLNELDDLVCNYDWSKEL